MHGRPGVPAAPGLLLLHERGHGPAADEGEALARKLTHSVAAAQAGNLALQALPP